ncbi:MAG: hypothetical protein AAGC54_08800, partial [Cyanobacteria bacterium P01_F01_bin.4]
PRPNHVFSRLADARWYIAISWCDQTPSPAGILTHDGTLSFQNQAALALGETIFLPSEQRQSIFSCCLSLESGKTAAYAIQPTGRHLEILGLEIDPRYGKVAVIKRRHSSGQLRQ